MTAVSHSSGPRRHDSLIEDAEPPPPYESVGAGGSMLVEANYARPYEVQDAGVFSEAPALPNRIPQQAPQSQTQTQQQYSQSFAPPPGPPPRHPSTNASTSNGSSSTPNAHYDGISTFNRPALPNQTPAHQQDAPQPAKYGPTVHPTSGQPLLNHGRILIYPQNHYCMKCGNTGYKACDPSNPHIACWEKYGKSYTSIIRNMPNFNFDNPTLQKPLPSARYTPAAPPLPPPPQHPSYYTAPSMGGYGRPQPPMWQGTHPSYNQQHAYQPAMQPMMSSPPMQQGPSVILGRPPPGASVYLPGDPRIGGHLCMICRGAGQISTGFLGLDTDFCPSCRGSGRVF